jgi:hypothetical protein
MLGDEVRMLAMAHFGLGRVVPRIPAVLSALKDETQETVQLVVHALPALQYNGAFPRAVTSALHVRPFARRKERIWPRRGGGS